MGIGNCRRIPRCPILAALITPHGDWKPTFDALTDTPANNSLPLMGIGNHHRRRTPVAQHPLITPHGDWKPSKSAGRCAGRQPHYPSWGLETRYGCDAYRRERHALITPHGDWKPRDRLKWTRWQQTHYPSWGLETVRPGALLRGQPDLITPHGDWKQPLPVWSVERRLGLITPHGDWKRQRDKGRPPNRTPHYPSWGLETPCQSIACRGAQTPHYPSWGLETGLAARHGIAR